jgi:hypothetical protein
LAKPNNILTLFFLKYSFKGIKVKPSSRRVQYTDLVATRNDMTTANYSYEANEEKLVYCAMVAVRKNELNKNMRFDPDELITISAANFDEFHIAHLL